VRSVGFQLSVAASAAVARWAEPIAASLPGPRVVREGLGVTIAAQLGVAPILVPRFGGMPVVALAANVVAVPVAGLVTTWGLPAGVVAGLAGGTVARAVHAPTELLIGWVAGVARVASRLPFGEVGPGALAVLAVAGAAAVAAGRGSGARRGAGGSGAAMLRDGELVLARRVAVLVVGAVLLAPAVRLRSPPSVQEPVAGARVVRSAGSTTVEVARPMDPVDLLAGLRRAGVRRIDLAVLPARQSAELERVLRHRWPVGRVIERG
jgi:competence protein ComEC